MKVKIKLQIHSGFASISSSDKNVYRELELPFAPYDGLSLVFPGEEEVVIENLGYGALSYNVETGVFNVWLEDKYLYDCALHRKTPERGIDSIYQSYLDTGWSTDGD